MTRLARSCRRTPVAAAAVLVLAAATACGTQPQTEKSPAPTAETPVSAGFCRDVNDYLWFSFAIAGQEPSAVPRTPAGLRHAYTRAASLAADLAEQAPASRRAAAAHLRDSLRQATRAFARYGFDKATYPSDLQARLVGDLQPFKASVDTYTGWLYSTCSQRFEATASPGTASTSESGDIRFSPGPRFPTAPPDARAVR